MDAVVENYTRGWSRSDYRLAVAFDSDVPLALNVFERVLFELTKEPRWHKIINEPPRVLGVESVASTGIVLRAWVETIPGKMFAVTRELNRRMLAAMSAEGIVLAMPIGRTFTPAPTPIDSPVQPEHTSQRDGESARQGGAPGAAATGEPSGREPT